MTEWIVIACLYAFGMGVFHLLGGLGAAADAFRDWGAWAARNRARRATSSS
jgi:hypothetical protein